MLSRIRAALERRHAAIVEAEALVWIFGSRGVGMAHAYARDITVSEERRDHYRRVARIAERRHDFMDGLDLATKYEEVKRWRRRRGSML
jgi:hypothetical protein